MISKKSLSFFLLLSIISGFSSFILLNNYTLPNEYFDKENSNLSEMLNYNYLNNHPKFNYIHGLWLMFTGIFIFSMVVILEIPKWEMDLRYMLIIKLIKK